MNRLTRKMISPRNEYCCKAECNYDCAHCELLDKVFNEFGRFEDFMEKQGFENLHSLKVLIDKINNYELGRRKTLVNEINEQEFFDMKEETQLLKDRWEKLKKWVSLTVNIPTQKVLDKMQELEKEKNNV